MNFCQAWRNKVKIATVLDNDTNWYIYKFTTIFKYKLSNIMGNLQFFMTLSIMHQERKTCKKYWKEILNYVHLQPVQLTDWKYDHRYFYPTSYKNNCVQWINLWLCLWLCEQVTKLKLQAAQWLPKAADSQWSVRWYQRRTDRTLPDYSWQGGCTCWLRPVGRCCKHWTLPELGLLLHCCE